MKRKGKISRKTKETSISVDLNIDGKGLNLIKDLLLHQAFDYKNPNKLRSAKMKTVLRFLSHKRKKWCKEAINKTTSNDLPSRILHQL